jgi:hypothetical protein
MSQGDEGVLKKDIDDVHLSTATCAIAFAALGLKLAAHNRESITLRDGRTMSLQQLFIEAIRLYDTFAVAYCSLGSRLAAGQTITLHDGRSMTQQQLFVEAIHHDSKSASAYESLGATLEAGQTITLRDGRSVIYDP